MRAERVHKARAPLSAELSAQLGFDCGYSGAPRRAPRHGAAGAGRVCACAAAGQGAGLGRRQLQPRSSASPATQLSALRGRPKPRETPPVTAQTHTHCEETLKHKTKSHLNLIAGVSPRTPKWDARRPAEGDGVGSLGRRDVTHRGRFLEQRHPPNRMVTSGDTAEYLKKPTAVVTAGPAPARASGCAASFGPTGVCTWVTASPASFLPSAPPTHRESAPRFLPRLHCDSG